MHAKITNAILSPSSLLPYVYDVLPPIARRAPATGCSAATAAAVAVAFTTTRTPDKSRFVKRSDSRGNGIILAGRFPRSSCGIHRLQPVLPQTSRRINVSTRLNSERSRSCTMFQIETYWN